MRLFVGLDIPQDIRDRLARFIQGLQSFAPEVRFANPESFHITLKFIGDTNKFEEIKCALAPPPATSRIRSFNASNKDSHPSHNPTSVQ